MRTDRQIKEECAICSLGDYDEPRIMLHQDKGLDGLPKDIWMHSKCIAKLLECTPTDVFQIMIGQKK